MADAGTGREGDRVVPLAKAEGAFLGLAAGDALGWPQEMSRGVRSGGGGSPSLDFRTWTRRGGGRFRPYEETIGAGEYSDDTQLTLAVARSRTNHGPDWWRAFMRVELPRWMLYERGGGGATKRAARAWLAGKPPWQSDKAEGVRRYFEAGGNGVAMRVLPHSLFLAGQDDVAEVVHDVVRDGVATHGHPRALVGATAWAYAAWVLARRSGTLRFGELLDMLLDEARGWGAFPDIGRGDGGWSDAAGRVFGAPYEQVWRGTVEEMRTLLDKARRGVQGGALADDRAVLDDLGCFSSCRGAGTVGAAGAAYLATRHAAQPAQGILRAAFEPGADTDTLAAMTGGLLGCLAGDEWLPAPWRCVQDSSYLRDLAGRVARGPAGAHHRSVETLVPPRTILADLPRKGDHEVALGTATRVQATALPDLRAVSKSISVRAWRLKTPEGQTLYVTRVEKREGAAGTRRTAAAARTGSSGGEDPSAERRGSVAGDGGREPTGGQGDSLYGEFRRQLRALMGAGPARPQDIAEALHLVPGQARQWLERAEQDGDVKRVSGKPVRFALRGGLLR